MLIIVRDKFTLDLEKVFQHGFRDFQIKLYMYFKISFGRLIRSSEEFFYLSSLWFTMVKPFKFEQGATLSLIEEIASYSLSQNDTTPQPKEDPKTLFSIFKQKP